jgi:HlyD family secretion protein
VKINFFACAVIAFAFILTGCSADEADTLADEEKKTPVKVASIKKEALTVEQEVIGILAANANVSVIPKVTGVLWEIHVSKGDEVKKGQVLATIEDNDLIDRLEIEKAAVTQAQLQLENAKINQEKAESGVANANTSLRQAELNAGDEKESLLRIQWNDAKKQLARLKPLYDQGAVSEQEFDQAVSAEKIARLSYEQGKKSYEQSLISVDLAKKDARQAKLSVDQAAASVRQAEQSLNQARKRLDDASVKATMAGEVVAIYSDAGDTVSNQSPLFTIVSLDPILVNANVSADQLRLFMKGSNVNVLIPSLHKEVTAEITYVSSITDDSGLYVVEAEIANPEKALKPGMAAKLVTTEVVVEDTLLVPTEAIIESGGVPTVFVIENGIAVEKEVEIIEGQSEWTAINGDFKENDEVVIRGQNTLADGTKVNIIEEGQSL